MFVRFDSVPEGYHNNAFLKNVNVVNSEYDHDGRHLKTPERYLELVFAVPAGGIVKLILQADVS